MIKELLAACAVVIVFSSDSYAQIPVTDGANLGNNISNHVESIAKYTAQLTQLKAQLTQAKQTYDQLNGLRDAGGLMNNELLNQFIPPEYQKSVDLLKAGKGGSLAGISGSLNDIVKQNQAQACDKYTSPAVQQSCRATWQNHAMNQYVGQAGYDQAARNIQNLQKFIDKIKGSPDPKSLQDLQARIAVEQVKVQNEKTKLDAVQAMEKAQQEMRRTNSIDNTVKSMKPGMIRF